MGPFSPTDNLITRYYFGGRWSIKTKKYKRRWYHQPFIYAIGLCDFVPLVLCYYWRCWLDHKRQTGLSHGLPLAKRACTDIQSLQVNTTRSDKTVPTWQPCAIAIPPPNNSKMCQGTLCIIVSKSMRGSWIQTGNVRNLLSILWQM